MDQQQNMLLEIRNMKREIERLHAVEIPISSRIVALSQVCRVLDDTTSRASGYSNTALQVTGVTDIRAATFTMPSSVKAVWYNFILLGTAGTFVNAVVENPDAPAGAVTLQGTIVAVPAAATAYTGSGVVSLSSLGRLSYTLRGSANITRSIIDIWAYLT